MSSFDGMLELFATLSNIALNTVIVVLGGATCLAVTAFFVIIVDAADTLLFFTRIQKENEKPVFKRKDDIREPFLVMGLGMAAVGYVFTLIYSLDRKPACLTAVLATATVVLGVALGLMVSVLIGMLSLKAMERLSGRSIRT